MLILCLGEKIIGVPVAPRASRPTFAPCSATYTDGFRGAVDQPDSRRMSSSVLPQTHVFISYRLRVSSDTGTGSINSDSSANQIHVSRRLCLSFSPQIVADNLRHSGSAVAAISDYYKYSNSVKVCVICCPSQICSLHNLTSLFNTARFIYPLESP